MVPDGAPTAESDGDPAGTNPLQPLYDPAGYFRARAPGLSLGRAVVVVLVAATLGTTIFGSGLWLVSEEMTGTITVDNPNRPPDWVCEQDDPQEGFEERCEEPEQVDRRIGDILWMAAGEVLFATFLGFCILWPVFGIGLHVTGVFAAGSGSIRDSFVLAAWGLIPSAASIVTGAIALWEALVGPDFSAGSPERLVEQVTAATQGVTEGPVGFALLGCNLLFVGWQGYVWGHGLSHTHDVPTKRALVAAGAFAVLAFAVGVVL